MNLEQEGLLNNTTPENGFPKLLVFNSDSNPFTYGNFYWHVQGGLCTVWQVFDSRMEWTFMIDAR